jgi:hypothetical protein
VQSNGWLVAVGLANHEATARPFFLLFALFSVAVVFAGFAPTFFIPIASRTFDSPLTVGVHAAFFLAWLSLLVVQTVLASSRKIRWHRQLGWSSAVLIPAMIASGVAVSLWATARDLRDGQGDAALAFLFGLFMDVTAFAVLASVAVMMRRKPQVHKRLIVLATIAILGPALGRIPIVGTVTTPIIVALVLSLAAYDLFSQSRVHPATTWGGLGLVASGFSQVPIGATTVWLSAARWIMTIAPY